MSKVQGGVDKTLAASPGGVVLSGLASLARRQDDASAIAATGVSSLPEHELTIAGFQDYIRQRYYQTDAARGTPATFMWFVEEVGELATALQKAAGQGGNTSGGENLQEEFADVLAWLCTLANINGIDLAQAIAMKYPKEGGPKGTK